MKYSMDYEMLSAQLSALSDRGVPMEITTLTRSILGKEIPLISLGKGKKAVLYVGALNGTAGVTAGVLLDFIADYLKQLERRSTVFEYAMRYLFEQRKIYILPMLNPDGVEYALNGVDPQNPIRERVLRMNDGADFSAWQANARGVDLGHNFDAGFLTYKQQTGIADGAPAGYSGEYPESEPETSALCRFLRLRREEIRGILALDAPGNEIFCSCGDNLSAKTTSVGRVLARFTGYRLARPEELCPIGTLSDWCITKLARPAFTVECGGGAGENRALVYEQLRRTLFSFPFLV